MGSKPKSTPLLFVYGTLMRGFPQARKRMARAEFLGLGTIRARLYDFGKYPGVRLCNADPGERVRGELYRLRDSTAALRELDIYEQYFELAPRKSLFARKRTHVTLDDGRSRSAWVYLYNRTMAGAKRIPGGCYRNRVVSLPSSPEVGS